MSNKTQLQTNNTALDALITRVNAAKDVAASLPEAGGGSGGTNLETITIIYDKLPDPGSMVYYLDGTMTLQELTLARNASFSVLKGSILITEALTFDTSFPSCTYITGNTMCAAHLVTG